MKFARLVLANLGRNKRRTILTISTNAMGVTFLVRQSQQPRIQALEGVKSVSWANWFGGVYQRPEDFFAQFAIDAETFLPMYPEIRLPADQRAAFMAERSAAFVGKGLMEKFGWHLGQTVTLKGTIYPGTWDFVIRGAYTPSDPSFGDLNFYFHYAYLYEKSGRQAEPNWWVLQLSDPSQAAALSQRVDDMFKNSQTPTKTGTEKAFSAGFVKMWGNVEFLMRAIGTAVFFAILFVAANTMMMAVRERVGEIAVLKTVGFQDGTVFGIIIAEAAIMTLLGGTLGLLGAKLLFGATHAFNGFLPGFAVQGSTLALGFAIAGAMGLVAGSVPAWQSARLSVVQALRKVA